MLGIPRKIIQKTANLFGYKITASSVDSDPVIDRDKRFKGIYNKCRKHTMTSKERMYALYKAVEYIVNSKIPGDFVECGVWKGGSTMLIAHTLIELKETGRKIYLYDTFAGMSEPTEADSTLLSKVPALARWKREQKKDYNKWAFSPLSEVKKNMRITGYAKDKLIFIKGKVEDTIPKTMPKRIALLRLDTDWYESTKHELTYLFPVLVENGVLIIDDYGHFTGAKKAVDEYFSQKPILLNRIDYTGRIGIKIK